MHNVYHATDNGYGVITVRGILGDVVRSFTYERRTDGSVAVYNEPFAMKPDYVVPEGEDLTTSIENIMYAEAGL